MKPGPYIYSTLVGVCVLAFAIASSAHATTYEITDLGTLGGTESYAFDLNIHGDVVGTSIREREEELLIHVAAGTDLLTAFAALPREDDQQPAAQPEPSSASVSSTALMVAILLALVLLWKFT